MPRKEENLIEPIAVSMDTLTTTVFSGRRTVQASEIALLGLKAPSIPSRFWIPRQ